MVSANAMASNIYDYTPSIAAAVVFAVLYSLTCLTTTAQYFMLRCWFWLFMVIASIMEAVGYIARIISAKNVTSTTIYAVSFLPIFLAPAVIAASCYMAMGRVILHVTPVKFRTWKSLWIKPRWMTLIFVTCDVISFLVQVVGGLKSATSDSASGKESAFSIMKIGLAIQLIRSIYRMIEFCTGFDGYLATHEWNFYVFEAALILPIFILFNIWHPAHYLSQTGWKQKRTGDELILDDRSDTNSPTPVLGERSCRQVV
ncbi:hypothetical protein N7471_005778 [Penicillium samsonianum]|uniref:uncharacterized protein n=1 Tax=Penicillium samsonianum TaxID=1882272 RepID=UPI0025468333|nr:uncharacterized protein N7471_005778 [Penicillium samsonianum]KAJ6139292.1 hypothetical protein N7471_005778 [Penicillium samsonianum]